MKRLAGQCSVEEHPKGSGRFRVRARIEGRLRTVFPPGTEAEAEEAAAAFTVTRNEQAIATGVTLSAFGIGFLARRERAGIRAIKGDRAKWSRHVERDAIGALAVATLGRRDVLDWLDRKVGLAHRTQKRLLNLLRVALQEAVDRELLPANPARDVRVNRASAATSTDDLEGILSPDEQQRLIAAVPERERPTVVFALCAGLRQAEQWWLRWEDVAGDRIVVRRSSGGLPPKGGKPREVFLLPAALAALETARRNPREHVWPARRGGRRAEGKPPRGWSRWVKAAGIDRHITWHDLRHTCATALLAGWWGRKWSLDEVCRLLGHSSVTVTERYARKLNETQALAVAATPGPGFVFPTGNANGGERLMLQGKVAKAIGFPKAKVVRSNRIGGAAGSVAALGTGWELATADALRCAAERVFARAGVSP